MRASMFNLQVPLPETGEVFLLNTLTDAQLLVSPDVASFLAGLEHRTDRLTETEQATTAALQDQGFIVDTREAEDEALDAYLAAIRDDREQLRVTVLTTLQCNFACEYCFQGDRGDAARFAQTMSPEIASKVAAWIERQIETVAPERLVITFLGGEPLLNLPVLEQLARDAGDAAHRRGVRFAFLLITNGLLLTPEVVDRLLPLGLTGVKVTLDGDRETHDRTRPLRGGQGTFDRIVANVTRVADKVAITIGGNFDVASADRFPRLLDFLREQPFADKLAKVAFKPVVNHRPVPADMIRLVEIGGRAASCGTSARDRGTSCDSYHVTDAHLARLRVETAKRGFFTNDGLHMGPCEIHRQHAHTIGPDGALYVCPGFTGEPEQAIGFIDREPASPQRASAERFARVTPRKDACGTCPFIPVCGGGCSAAAHAELHDVHAPACHRESFEAALVSLARTAAEASREVVS